MKFGRYLPAIVLAGATLFFAYDIIMDVLTGIDSVPHIIVELFVCLAMSVVMTRELQHIRRLDRVLVIEQSKNARLIGDMLSVINARFQNWGLSASESEVALLLIKGLSMKEIAEARAVKEKTVRTQAANIYAKSGQSGRHELAAYFMEDLMSGLPVAKGEEEAQHR